MSKQEPWEIALEDALGAASPEEVVKILKKIKGWTLGYCETCGIYTDFNKSKAKCSCPHKGFWYENP